MLARVRLSWIGSATLGATQGDLDVAAHGATHLFHRIVQRQADNLFTIQMGDEVARLHPGAGGGVSSMGEMDLDEAILRGHLNARPPNSPRVCTRISAKFFLFR